MELETPRQQPEDLLPKEPQSIEETGSLMQRGWSVKSDANL